MHAPLNKKAAPVVNFLSAGSQLGTDNSLLTTMFLAVMAKVWFKSSWGVSLLVVCSIGNTIWRVHGKSHMAAIVPYKHHVHPALS